MNFEGPAVTSTVTRSAGEREWREGEVGVLFMWGKEENPGQSISEVYSRLSEDPKHHLSNWFKAIEASCAHPEGTKVMPVNRSDG